MVNSVIPKVSPFGPGGVLSLNASVPPRRPLRRRRQQTARTAQERVKDRVNDILNAQGDKPRALRRTMSGLAEAIGVRLSTLSDLLNEELPAAEKGWLYRLDDMAEYVGVTPSDLVKRTDDPLVELSPMEHRVLKHLRQFPPVVQEQIAFLYDYFGGLLPEELEERRWLVRIRRLNARNRAALDDTIRGYLLSQRRAPSAAADAASETTGGAPAPAAPPPQKKRQG